MNKILYFLMALSGIAWATPQTSDADLRASQIPPLVFAATPNFQGLRAKLSGNLANSLDLSVFASGLTTLDLSEVTGMSGTSYIFSGIPLTGVGEFVASLPSSVPNLALVNCGLSDVSGFLAAVNATTATGSLYLDSNPIDGAIGAVGNTSGGYWYLSLSSCGITGVGTLGTIEYGGLDLASNAITTLDLSRGPTVVDWSGIDFNDNPLTTLTTGDGVSTGVVSANTANLLFEGCALPSAQVNAFLDALVTMQENTGSVASINLSGGTTGAPTDDGITSAAALVAAGWTVTSN